MKTIQGFVFLFVLLVTSPCYSKSLPEEDSVVSVYTTQATTSGTSGLDIYQQIANNIAEKISSPFYRFFRVERNKTEEQPITKKPWEKIELLDEPEPTKFKEDNELDQKRDIEELSEEASKKGDTKPEKNTLYNSYLPVLRQNIEQVDYNDTMNEIDGDFDDELTLEDVEPTPREGPFIFMLELIGSFIQLVWGAISSLFPLSSNSGQSEQKI